MNQRGKEQIKEWRINDWKIKGMKKETTRRNNTTKREKEWMCEKRIKRTEKKIKNKYMYEANNERKK